MLKKFLIYGIDIMFLNMFYYLWLYVRLKNLILLVGKSGLIFVYFSNATSIDSLFAKKKEIEKFSRIIYMRVEKTWFNDDSKLDKLFLFSRGEVIYEGNY